MSGAQGARDNDLLSVVGALGAITDVFVFLALEQLAADLLVKVKEASPAFFEKLVVELLVAMGYGGSHGRQGRRRRH